MPADGTLEEHTLARAAHPGGQRASVDDLDQELALRRPPGPIREAR